MKELELKYYTRDFDGGFHAIHEVKSKLLYTYRVVDENSYTKIESYYDTEDFNLRKKGIYVRIDDLGRLMVKIGNNDNGLFVRDEILFSKWKDFVKFIDGFDIYSTNIKPQFGVVTARGVLTVDLGCGIVDVCSDIFRYSDVGDNDNHYELEFELKSGDEKALDIIREMMLEYVGDDLRPSEISKAERGFQLMTKEG